MKRISKTLVLFTTFWCGVAVAANPPPSEPFNPMAWPALSNEKPTTKLKMGTFTIAYEMTTLDDVRNKVGYGQIAYQGDAAESVYWLCYTAQSARIWIMSGEMGGSEHAVLEVAVEHHEFAEPRGDCPALPATLQPVSFERGLWVGTSEKSVLQNLAQPSRREGDWLSFNYVGKEPGACKPYDADLTNWALVKLKKGRVIRIHAMQVTSC